MPFGDRHHRAAIRGTQSLIRSGALPTSAAQMVNDPEAYRRFNSTAPPYRNFLGYDGYPDREAIAGRGLDPDEWVRGGAPTTAYGRAEEFAWRGEREGLEDRERMRMEAMMGELRMNGDPRMMDDPRMMGMLDDPRMMKGGRRAGGRRQRGYSAPGLMGPDMMQDPRMMGMMGDPGLMDPRVDSYLMGPGGRYGPRQGGRRRGGRRNPYC